MDAARYRWTTTLLLLTALTVPALASAQNTLPPRTFPQFAGTWTLDEGASTGRLTAAPASTLTITTSPDAISVAKVVRPRPQAREVYAYDPALPNPEVYRFDGRDTTVDRFRYIYDYSFRLVADQLALTLKTSRRGFGDYTIVTDAYAIEGDRLLVHRQFSSISAEGHIRAMQEPANNSRHTFVYRRPPAAE
jgi:hypothetical protein